MVNRADEWQLYAPDPGKNRGGYTQNRGLCGPRYWSGFSAKKDLLILLENEV